MNYLTLIIALIGLIIYFITEKPKVMEVGRIMFAFGLLAYLLGVK